MNSTATTKTLTFVVNTPIYRVLTFKQFKEEFASTSTEEQAKAIWKKLGENATKGEFVTEAMTSVEVEESVCLEDEVNDLIEEKVEEAKNEVEEELEEGEVKET
jgi:hypothetical protein